MRLLSKIPGLNSFGTLHDWITEWAPHDAWWYHTYNVPSMVPAFAVNAAALSYGLPATFAAANKEAQWW